MPTFTTDTVREQSMIGESEQNASGTRQLPFGKDVEVFFDRDCPLCRREVDMVRRLDRLHRVKFTAIQELDPVSVDRSYEQLMDEIHARLPDGKIISGVDVFRRMYSAVGFRWAARLSALPGIRQACDLAYRLFARNRLRLTGRCSAGHCDLGAVNTDAERGKNQSDPCPVDASGSPVEPATSGQ